MSYLHRVLKTVVLQVRSRATQRCPREVLRRDDREGTTSVPVCLAPGRWPRELPNQESRAPPGAHARQGKETVHLALDFCLSVLYIQPLLPLIQCIMLSSGRKTRGYTRYSPALFPLLFFLIGRCNRRWSLGAGVPRRRLLRRRVPRRPGVVRWIPGRRPRLFDLYL